MNLFSNPTVRKNAAHASILALALMGALLAQTATAQSTKPSQNPLLVNPTGAKPNLMLTMDNSGSMAFPYHETYGITGSTDLPLSSGGWVRINGSWVYQSSNSRPYEWSAQRSADVNPIYYNPRVHYSARVDQSGADLVATDGIKFVSNQDSGWFEYYATYSSGKFVSANSVTANSSRKPGGVAANNTIDLPRSGGTASLPNAYHLNSKNRSIPRHTTYLTDSAASGKKFTWVVCTNPYTSGGEQIGCNDTTISKTEVTFGATASITLPADHDRAKLCPSGVCSNAEEVRNIVTWYRYYSTRSEASATAIGQALADKDFYNKLRVGYFTIDRPESGAMQTTNNVTPGKSGEINTFSRGVRLLSKTNTDTSNFYDWLYKFPVAGGTPLHNSMDRVANYYKMEDGVVENPYRTDPTKKTSSTNPELSCRRSFNLLFSDGSWTADSSTNKGQNSDYQQGPEFTSADGTKFRYEAGGLGGGLLGALLGRKAYTPYGSNAKGGLADLAAKYYWTQDFSTSLANDVPTDTDNGKPTFWQNMATYTVGYQVKPSGDVPGAASGLTFAQIDKLTNQYPLQGLLPSLIPSWPSGEMGDQSDAKRVDDFIQAGFTGGGQGFSASSAEEVRDVFNIILHDVLGSSGADAGVAVSSSSNGATTIDGSLKYLVSFRTRNNSGDLTAYELDEDGDVKLDTDGNPVAAWSANEEMPDADDRNVFTISGKTSPEELKGNFSSLSPDIRAALKIGDVTPSRIANNSSFVDYLRGDDQSTDANGKLFRQRAGILGAMVNPPSVYMGSSSYIKYNNTNSTVSGKDDFTNYQSDKDAAPASVVVATNAGAAHVLKADTGKELAAFMPRRSLSHMLSNASSEYEFEYVLDGPLSENDIYDETSDEWKHIAVGTGGRGEKLIYALRSPINKSATSYNRQPTVDDFLWETGPTNLPSGSTATATNELNDDSFSVGYMTNESRAGQTEDGTWVVVVNSGHYNGKTDGSQHGLLVLNPRNGEVIKRIPLPNTYSAGRGLSGITMIRNSDLRIVGAYAGDANGNLWRFTLTGAKSTWKVAYGKPLYTTENNRPIYGNPAWQSHPTKGAIVVFATGILLEDDDIGDTDDKESIYGIWDPTLLNGTEDSGFTTRTTSKLLTQTVDTGVADTVGIRNFYTTSENSIDWTTHQGWRMALGWKSTGERNLTGVMNLKKNVLITTTAISLSDDTSLESCTVTNSPANFIYSLRALDGRLTPSFDTDGDGKPDDVSVMEVPSGGYSRGNALIRTDSLSDLGGGPDGPALQGTKGEFPDEKCSPSGNDKAATLVGVGNESAQIFSVCPSANWSRTQYQLSEPPNNN